MKLRLERSRLQDRIVLFVVALLATVQLASFFFIRYSIEQTAQSTLRDELGVAARVFRRLLEQTDQQRVDASQVIALDFGLRAAIATREAETMLSALRNHAARIRAGGMEIIALDGRVVADLLEEANTGPHDYGDPDLIRIAGEEGRAIGVRLLGSQVYRVIVVPVLAPLPIAWISVEFPIDAKLARDMQKLSSSDVSFVTVAGGTPRLVASTLPPSRQGPLAAQAKRIVAEGLQGINVKLDEESYEALAVPLPDAGRLRIYAILQRSRADRIAPYLALQAALLFIAAVSVAVTFAGSIRIARRITRPVSALAEAAREIARGNYAVRTANAGRDEIAELSRAFDGMAQGLEERDRVRDVLGKVASSEVVKQLLDRRIELGGQELDATVMFTDLRDFTALCEKLTPQQSLAFLNEFLTEISEVVEAHGGVVDKYVGDGVMALFGAPVTRPDDAQRAVEAAIEVRDRIERLRPRLAARGMPSPEIGIGLSTSRVVAGNVGSPSRLNYTVLGDGVNLGSRLEGLTKRYHVPIVVSDRTRASVTGIVFRELDKVRVKGRSEATRIWQPLGREGTLSESDLEHLSRWHEALHLFRNREFSFAHELFTSLVVVDGYQRGAAIYLEHIATVRANPPGPGWDASFTLYDK